MTRYDTPGYYAVVGNPEAVTTLDDYIEGRIFLHEETLVCGAGDMEGYGGTVDEYSGSSIRVLFGKKYDPQQFGYKTAQTRDESITVPINAITDVKLIEWKNDKGNTSKQTYGVILTVPSELNDDLIIQLGKGIQNRGVGKKRHIAFANALAERCTTKESETISPDTTSESESESATTTQSDSSSKEDVIETNPEQTSDKTGSKKSVTADSDSRSADSSSEKRRWTFILIGIILFASPAVIFSVLSGGILLANSSLIPIVGLVSIIGIVSILFGIYRIIRY